MSQEQFEPLEAQLRAWASAFPYPATPNIARAVSARLSGRSPTSPGDRRAATYRRLAIALAVLALLLTTLLAVPQVRAAVLDVLRLGAVRIHLVVLTPTPAPPTSATSISSPAQPPAIVPATATPLPTVLDLAGETTLVSARAQIRYPIRLPSYPAGLGAPDHVFLLDTQAPAVILVWLDKTTGHVRLSLHVLGPGMFVDKGQPRFVQETTVHGTRALWTEGPYLVRQRNGEINFERLIEGHVLIWQEGDLTYRLETDLSMPEAVKIAESLR